MTDADALAALNSASAGPVAEGNVGGGNGMRSYQICKALDHGELVRVMAHYGRMGAAHAPEAAPVNAADAGAR